MKRIFLTVLAANLALTLAVRAEERTNFSGTWKMDPARSESAHQAVPIGPVTLVIKHTPSELHIETRRSESYGSTISTETLTYKLDGTESTIKGTPGASVKTKANWDGAKLITKTARNVQGLPVTTTLVLSLNASGSEMTIDKTLTVQHGYQAQGANNTGTGKDVFIKTNDVIKK